MNLVGQRVSDVRKRYGPDEPNLADLDRSLYLHDEGAFVEGVSLYTNGTLERPLPSWIT
jgi:hypothetical protein